MQTRIMQLEIFIARFVRDHVLIYENFREHSTLPQRKIVDTIRSVAAGKRYRSVKTTN